MVFKGPATVVSYLQILNTYVCMPHCSPILPASDCCCWVVACSGSGACAFVLSALINCMGWTWDNHSVVLSLLTSLYFCRYSLSGSMYASNPSVVIAYKISSPVIVFLFSCIHRSFALWTVKVILLPKETPCFLFQFVHALKVYTIFAHKGYSLVIKLMNSDTHSCIHSLESLPTYTTIIPYDYPLIYTLTLPLLGNAFFITRPTLAIGKNLSCVEHDVIVITVYNTGLLVLYILQRLFSFLPTLVVWSQTSNSEGYQWWCWILMRQ